MAEKEAKREKEELHKQLSIKERLLRRLRYRTVPVVFEDEGGEFTVEVRLLSPVDQRKLYQIQQELGRLTKQIVKANTTKKQNAVQKKIEKLDDQTCEFMEKICVDPELNKEFWKRGEGYSVDVPAKLIREVMRLSSAGEEEIRFLREEAKGKVSSNS